MEGSSMTNDQYLAFQLAMADQLVDLQKNGKTYFKETKDWRNNTVKCDVGDVYAKAYRNVLHLIEMIKQNPNTKLTCYNGQWYTKEEIDKMFYKDIC